MAPSRRPASTWTGDVTVAVNLSPSQFRGGLVRAIRALLEAAGLPARRLALEIIESALLRGNEVLATLHELRDCGVEIALDDFGTGYSSLSCLCGFPFDRIKIDRSFVREMHRRPDCLAIVRSVAQLAQTLGMAATAEGIETPEQLDQVRRAGCTQAQGHTLRPAEARIRGRPLARASAAFRGAGHLNGGDEAAIAVASPA